MAGITAIVIALLVGGLVTPQHHEVSRELLLPDADHERVWDTVRRVDLYATWRDDVRDSVLVDVEQPQVRWRETSRRGSMTFGIVHEDAPHAMTARILDDDLPFSGEWRWHLHADNGGIRIQITESGDVHNPVYRFLGAHVIGFTRSIDAYLAALARHHGCDGAPIADAGRA